MTGYLACFDLDEKDTLVSMTIMYAKEGGRYCMGIFFEYGKEKRLTQGSFIAHF